MGDTDRRKRGKDSKRSWFFGLVEKGHGNGNALLFGQLFGSGRIQLKFCHEFCSCINPRQPETFRCYNPSLHTLEEKLNTFNTKSIKLRGWRFFFLQFYKVEDLSFSINFKFFYIFFTVYGKIVEASGKWEWPVG